MEKFTLEDVKFAAAKLGIDFSTAGYTAEEYWDGLQIELEHGLVDARTNVSNDDLLTTAKIVLAHLTENTRYYDQNVGLEAWEHALDQVKGDTTGKKVVIL
ncbi:MAG: hypothetical protein LLG09_06140 [Negativicutes bacterium]|nr:hypothetical protein [Negativicutes bacterium]